jgi:type 1 glutamine amidotransferase/nicotinamidase-related amidase
MNRRNFLDRTKQTTLGLAALLAILANARSVCADDAGSASSTMTLHTRNRVESPADGGQSKIVYKTVRWDATKTAVIICDMWDRHWCKSAMGREAEMAPRMDRFIAEARRRGTLIVHAPCHCMAPYERHPARRRAQNAPDAHLPAFLNGPDHKLQSETGPWPIDQSDDGCDCTPPCTKFAAWRRQTDALHIADEDAISDSAVEIGNLFVQRGIENVMLVGIHANMCVMARRFGLRNMVRLGKNVVLVRDLTDTMYNPRMAPRVSHVRGTELMLEYIEKYVCPTIAGSDLIGGAAFRFREDRRPHVVLLSYEDKYRSAETLPRLAGQLCDRHGCSCCFLWGEKMTGIFGLDELAAADALVLYVRRHPLPKEQMATIRRYLEGGKPLVALRTASHAFDLPTETPAGWETWPAFDRDVLGCNYHSHQRAGRRTDISVADNAAGHPILAGIERGPWTSSASLYSVSPIDPGATILLTGKCEGSVEPIAWTRNFRGSRVFYTSLGSVEDFQTPQFRAMLFGAIHWAINRPMPSYNSGGLP